MTKILIKKRTTVILTTGILILLCACLIYFYNIYNDNNFRKKITKIQDDNVYNKNILKATDVLYDNEQIYLRLENIANILNSSYKEDKNKSLLKSSDIKLELLLNSKRAKLNKKEYVLKQKIIKTNNIRFISKEDIENIYNIIFDENSLTLFSKYSSKILIIKAQDKNKIIKTKPVKLISNNKLYIAKYKTIKDTQNAYNVLKKDKNISVNIESVIKVSRENSNNNTTKEKKETITDLGKYINKNKTNKKVIIAIIDSGINYNLNLFKNRIVNTKYNYSSSGKDAKDDFGHGTTIASIIVNNTDKNIKLLPIKVINKQGESSILSVYLGIKKAIDEKVDIINISLNARYSYEAEIIEDIINEATNKGIKVIVSAGNNANNVKYYTPSNIKSAIVVAASNDKQNPTSYSNKGNMVDLCTYGEYINVLDLNGNITSAKGTSCSAAMISAIYASLKTCKNTDLTPFLEKTKNKDIGDFISLYSINSQTTENKKIEDILIQHIDDWDKLSKEKLNKLYKKANIEEQAFFYQNLSKKDKEKIRKQIKDLNEDTISYNYQIDKDNNLIVDKLEINKYGDIVTYYKLKENKIIKKYKYLDEYKLSEKFLTSYEFTNNEEGEDKHVFFKFTYRSSGYFYVDFENERYGDATCKVNLKINPDLYNVSQTPTVTLNLIKYNFKVHSSTIYTDLGNNQFTDEKATELYEVVHLKYQYDLPAHTNETYKYGGDPDTRCDTCVAHVQSDGSKHSEIEKTVSGKMQINFHNCGIRNVTNSDGTYCTNGTNYVHHKFYLKDGKSSLKLNLNDASHRNGTTEAKYYLYPGTNTMGEAADDETKVTYCNESTNWLRSEATRDGYEFKGWNTEGNKIYNKQLTIPLYELGCQTDNYATAQWEPYKILVNFDFQGGKDGKPLHLTEYKTIEFDTKPIMFLENKPITGLDISKGEKLPKKSGNVVFDYYYTLPNKYGTKTETKSYSEPATGYYHKSTGGVRCIEPDGSGSNRTWIINPSPDSDGKRRYTLYAQYNISIEIPSNPTKDGYIFKGWSTNPNVDPYNFTGLKEGSTYNPTGGDEKLYAIWEPIKYKVELYPETPDRAKYSHTPHYSEPTFGHFDWTWTGICWSKTLVFDETYLTEYPSEMFYLRGWDTNNPYWYALDINTSLLLGKASIIAPYYENLTIQQNATIKLYPKYTEHNYTIKFIRSKDTKILNETSGNIPDMELLYEDYTCAPDGSELYKVKEGSNQVFRFFICDENNIRYYQNDYNPPIYQLTDVDDAILHFVAQWLPFKIKIDYFSITDRERGKDIIFSEGVFGQLEIQVEEEVEKIRVELPQSDNEYPLSNYIEYVTKYDEKNLNYSLDPNFKRIYEYQPIGTVGINPVYPLYPKKSNTEQLFFVKYSYKPLVTKKIWVHSFRDRRWINSTATNIHFENRDRVPMSGKIRTRIRYDSWLED